MLTVIVHFVSLLMHQLPSLCIHHHNRTVVVLMVMVAVTSVCGYCVVDMVLFLNERFAYFLLNDLLNRRVHH